MKHVFRAILFLALVASVIWVWTRGAPEEGASEVGLASAGEGFDDVERLVFDFGGDSIVVEQRDGVFWVVHPLEDLANEFRIRQTIRGMSKPMVGRSLADADPSRFGLQPPERRFRAYAASGEVWGVDIGDSAAVSAEVYARGLERGAPVVMMDRFSTRRDFYPDLLELRDPVALPLQRPVVDSIHVMTRTDSFRARRVRRDLWVLTDPPDGRLDPALLNRAIRHLRTGNIREYADESLIEDLSDLGLDPPRATWIFYQEGETDTVRFGHPLRSGELVWCIPSRRSFVVRLTADFYRDFVDGLDALRDRHLLTIPLDSLETVEVLGESPLLYEDSASGWLHRLPDGSTRREEGAAADIENLLQVQARRTPDVSTWTPRGVELSIRLVTAARAETLWLAECGVDSVAVGRSTEQRDWVSVPRLSWMAWSHRAAHRHDEPARDADG